MTFRNKLKSKLISRNSCYIHFIFFCLPAYQVKYKTKAHRTITVLWFLINVKHGLAPCQKIQNRGVWKYLDLRDRSNGSVETSNWGKVKTMLCLLNSAPRHENVWGSGSIDILILNLGKGMGWVVNFTPRLLYTSKKELPVPTEYEAQWAPQRVCTFRRRDKSSSYGE